jgi:hypothetical protein
LKSFLLVPLSIISVSGYQNLKETAPFGIKKGAVQARSVFAGNVAGLTVHVKFHMILRGY